MRLPYRAPYDWAAMLAFLRARAIPGVERSSGERYARTVATDGAHGCVAVARRAGEASLAVDVRFPEASGAAGDHRARAPRVRRRRRPGAIGAHLARDPLLAPLVTARPGLRVPGGWDGFELAARAILGQQVTVEAGRQLAGALVRTCGRPVAGRSRRR